jgi:hypothetical protein
MNADNDIEAAVREGEIKDIPECAYVWPGILEIHPDEAKAPRPLQASRK